MDLSDSLTIETKCWEKDWRWVLDDRRLSVLWERVGNVQTHRVIYINNCVNYKEPCRAAEKRAAQNLIDEFYIVDNHATETLKKLKIEKESFQGGYNYSIAELFGIINTKTPYLLHFASDVLPEASLPPDWLSALLQKLSNDNRIAVTNLTWDGKFDEARRDSETIEGDWGIGYGFSDQMYMVRIDEFRRDIYNLHHPAGDRYPKYGGNLFEKRVDAYMRTNGRKRATWLHGSYRHRNYPNRLNTLFWRQNW